MTSIFEHAIETFARRAPGWLVGATGLAVYGGGGLAVPLILHWPTAYLVEANLVATSLAVVVGLAWLLEQLGRLRRRYLLQWTTNLRLLDSTEFEWLVGELFRREGWTVTETGSADGPDGNVDLDLRRDRRRRLVQCKRWTSWKVGVEDVRAFAGTLMREGMVGADGIFVTLSSFTDQAQREARSIGLELVDGASLQDRLEAVRRVEPCPLCGQGMVLDRSVRGWWFRCRAQGCTGKRDLSADPGRAVELLSLTA
jgi:HJR/Mrr/RecB family endonuclease